MTTSKITKKTIAAYLLLNLIVLGAAIALSLVWNSKAQKQKTKVPSGSAQKENVVGTQIMLQKPWIISPGKPILLVLNVTDRQGKPVARFDTFQERLMHLIVVSNDFQFFEHLHPTFKGNGRFEVDATFPISGRYTLFSSYKPAKQEEEIAVLKVQTPGDTPATSEIIFTQTKTFGQMKANLSFSEPILKAGKEVTLNFNLKQANNGHPATDLEPYLGERGHLVILRQTEPLSKTDYIHTHAMKGASTGQVSFMTTFPNPGKYKIWRQFNRNGKVMVIDFWVNVS
jgi:hypothetical protein